MSFDKLAGVYVYCMNYSGGIWSREYSLLCKIQEQYKLRLSDNAIKQIQDEHNESAEWYDAQQVYRTLAKI